MTALATSADVVADLGRALTTIEAAKVASALDKASALIRDETRRLFEADTFVVRRKVRDGKVVLDNPESVNSVVEVSEDGSESTLTGYVLRGSVLYGLGCDKWVEIDYDSVGSVPDELVTITAAIAARNITTTAPEGAESYTVTRGPFSESASFSEATDSASALPSEMKVIRKYALARSGPVSQL
jgi:hypothetical protein